MKINEKVEQLRVLLKKKGLAAWVINGTDPHQSEYVNDRWQSRAYISGFTGSAGVVVITLTKALIWVDSRYFIQCASQIKGSCFEMRKIDGPDATRWDDFLLSEVKKKKVGISAETLTVAQERKLKNKGINICPSEDLLDFIWTDRPGFPDKTIEKMSDLLCGETVESKIRRIREKATEVKCSYVLVSSLDDIAWILNLRGDDIEDTSVFLSYLLIGPKRFTLFTDPHKLDGIHLEKDFDVYPYERVGEVLGNLNKTSLYLNPECTNMLLYKAINRDVVKIVEGPDFSTMFKACKNAVELEGIRTAHILDGVAMVNFLGMVKSKKTAFTELSIAQCLENERALETDYIGPSFTTIAGFAEHGAVVHYSATKKTDKHISGNGLLILDSGGQYKYGTTDITRTLLFGRATKEQKRDYTLVLKGHLALASAVFPKGANGHQIDALAHQFLWQNGMDYFHGTGHGVGFRLSVHEGPQRISASKTAAGIELKPGMVISDEPGVYKEGKYGIRIENLIAVVPFKETEFGTFYSFEVLTCCPYERNLIDKTMLTSEEVLLIDTYHAWVYRCLKDMVNKEGLKYLKEATKPL